MSSYRSRLGWRASYGGHALPADNDALVFSGKRGNPIESSTAFRAVKAAATSAGVAWAGPHTLRHTCATMLFRHGLNAKQVQLWLGHHSPAFTLAAYVHLLPDDMPDVEFLDALLLRRPVKVVEDDLAAVVG